VLKTFSSSQCLNWHSDPTIIPCNSHRKLSEPEPDHSPPYMYVSYMCQKYRCCLIIFGDFLIHTVSLLITDPLINPQSDNGTTCLVSLLRCHLVYRLPSSSHYMARLLPDVVFTGVVRQRCQSGLLILSNQRASARLGSARLGSARLSSLRLY
jgi:hypothetical protein